MVIGSSIHVILLITLQKKIRLICKERRFSITKFMSLSFMMMTMYAIGVLGEAGGVKKPAGDPE